MPIEDQLPQPALERKRRRTVRVTDPEDQVALQSICSASYTPDLYKSTPAPGQFLLENITTDRLRHESSSKTTDPSPQVKSPSVPHLDLSYISYPTDVALWPDYSDMLELPQIVQDNHQTVTLGTEYPTQSDSGQQYTQSSSSTFLSDLNNLPAVPACPCLPNLYLTLSTLSTLNSFPVTIHTITTLQSAQRTALTVLHCKICPTVLQSALQNVVLLGTLLTVLADAWLRIRRTPLEEFRRGCSQSGPQPSQTQFNMTETLEWQTFKHSLIRNHVFADEAPPILPSSTNSPSCPLLRSDPSTALLTVVNAMIRRQSQWHNPDDTTSSEFPKLPRGTHADPHLLGLSLQEIQALERDESCAPEPTIAADRDSPAHFCLALVSRAKKAVKSLDYPAPRWGE